MSVLSLGLTLAVTAYLLARLAASDLPVVLEGGDRHLGENVVIVAAELLGAAIAAWLSFGVLLAVLAFVLGLRIRIRLLPRTVGRLVAGILGVSVALGAAIPASAATPSLKTSTPNASSTTPVPASATRSPVVQTDDLDPGWTDTSGTSEAAAPSPKAPGRNSASKPTLVSKPAASGVVVVQSGDTLWDIAEESLGSGSGRPTVSQVAREWPKWFRANRSTIGSDPDVLVPGMALRIPKSAR